MPLPSIARRLSWTLLAAALASSVAVSAGVWLAVRHEVRELLDDTLQGAAEALRPPLSQGLPATPPPAGGHPASDRYAWQLVDYGAGAPRVLLASSRAPATPMCEVPCAGFADRAAWRVFGIAAGPPGRMLLVAQSHEEQREAVLEVVLYAALATLAIGLLSHLWLRVRVAGELAPLQRLGERLRGHDLLAPAATLGPAERAELQPVHQAIDQLALQLNRRLAQERAFSAHAAHALRTPLAGIDAQLAVAMREAPEALQPRLQRVRSAAHRLQRVVAALLALFRSGVEPRREPVRLADLLARVPVDGLVLEVDPQARVEADPDLLAAALMNLLDNALRHGGRQVSVRVDNDGAVRVADDGPGVDATRRAVLRQALAGDRSGGDTADAARDGATGLGLLLAHLVARAHGGGLELPDSAAGFVARLHLGPGAPDAEAR